MSDGPPRFDPTKPYAVEGAPAGSPRFDPAKPYTTEAAQGSPPSGSAMGALWHGLLHGAGNVPSGLEQLWGHLTGGGQAADAAAQARERAYRGPFAPGLGKPLSEARSHPVAAGIGRTLGEIGATAPLAAVPGGAGLSIPARMALGAATGAAGAGAMPVTGGNDYWTQKAIQAGVGGTLGGSLGALGAGAAPRLSPEARMLEQQKVRLTPGMRMGPFSQGAERALQAFPIVGGYVRGQVGRSIEDFNRAAVRQALEPIGAIVSRDIKAGHPLMQFATDQLDRAYNQVLPHLTLSQQGVAHTIQTNQNLQQLVAELPDDLQRRFVTIMQNRVLGKFPPGGVIDGQAFKTIESYLSRRATGYAHTNDAELGEALNGVMGVLRDELATQNPQFAPVLQKINHSYAMFTRLREASQRRSTSSGIFTPADLLASVKTLDPSAGHGSFARGDALLQVLGEAGQKVMSGSMVSQSDRFRLGDLLMDTLTVAPHQALRGAQAVPGLGRTVAGASPGLGAVGGAAIQSEPPKEPVKVGDRGPAGGTVIGVRHVRRPAALRPQDADYVEPPP